MINLDHNATTPVAEAVLAAMLPWFREHPGNPASAHALGRRAATAVDTARRQVAEAINARPQEIIFTSGSTEATNLALRGTPGPVVVAATEHKAALDTAQSHPGGCTVVAVDSTGRIDLDELRSAAPHAHVVSVMLANNETGVVQDLPAIVAIAHEVGALVHTDSTQALGKIPVDLDKLGVDLASFSAHKIEGPKGTGCLFVRRGVAINSVMTGGGHERGLRSGTLNVPGIVGFGEAAERAAQGLDDRRKAMRSRSQQLLEGLAPAHPLEIFSDHHLGLPNTLSVRFVGADGEAVMAHAPDVAMSLGSACTNAIPEPSHVLRAMGVTETAAFETVRLSVGAETTPRDIDKAAAHIVQAVETVRRLAQGAHNKPNKEMVR